MLARCRTPCVLAVLPKGGDTVDVCDGWGKKQIALGDLFAAATQAVDSSYIVSFHVGSSAASQHLANLLDLAVG